MATNSTITAPDRAHAARPQHPYGMYPQNTVPEEEGAPVLPAIAIPVGFPGLGQSYQRRLGPEGEEAADIIGPDGHTEQLPPYTQYPDAIPRKADGTVAPVPAPEPEPASARSPDTAPQTPIATSSRETVNPAQSRLSTRSVMSDSSGARLTTGGLPVTERNRKISSKEKWTETGKKRVCFGKLPLWAICTMGVAFFILAVLLGGLIGGVVMRKQGPKYHDADDDPNVLALSSP